MLNCIYYSIPGSSEKTLMMCVCVWVCMYACGTHHYTELFRFSHCFILSLQFGELTHLRGLRHVPCVCVCVCAVLTTTPNCSGSAIVLYSALSSASWLICAGCGMYLISCSMICGVSWSSSISIIRRLISSYGTLIDPSKIAAKKKITSWRFFHMLAHDVTKTYYN